MNLGRFHSAICDIKKEMEDCATLQILAELQRFLQESISQQTPESARKYIMK